MAQSLVFPLLRLTFSPHCYLGDSRESTPPLNLNHRYIIRVVSDLTSLVSALAPSSGSGLPTTCLVLDLDPLQAQNCPRFLNLVYVNIFLINQFS